MFEREDWTLFRNLPTLSQKAGVPEDEIPGLVAKELTDNALDAAGSARVGLLTGGRNGFRVEDDGAGIPGTDDEIAALFSINRPLTSTKVLRLPTRGALGNGLRVVAGAVLASRGYLAVATRGRVLHITPDDRTGRSAATPTGPYDGPGARVEVEFGPALPVTEDDLRWAREAITLARGEAHYDAGKSSPHWFDSAAFYELCRAARDRTVRELVAQLDGCSGPKAGKIAAGFQGRLARDLSRAEADQLLGAARERARKVSPKRLGQVGPGAGLGMGYGRSEGLWEEPARHGGFGAEIPYVVEAWVELRSSGGAGFRLAVNRTPTPAEIAAWHHKNDFIYQGCGVHCRTIPVGKKPVGVWVNIDTPYMPITSDGKTPNLIPFVGVVDPLIRTAVKRARRGEVPGEDRAGTVTMKDKILAVLDEAIEKTSGGLSYGPRNLFYVARDLITHTYGPPEPSWGNFNKVITLYEAELGHDLPGIARDNRGVLYHPHTGEEIPLGTLNVEQYGRPEWTFNKVLYCEKEGIFPVLKDARWAERHDCALLTSKGFATRAARDVIDLLGDTQEEITFYCIHDADGPGTMIYQTLQEATKARPARKVRIVNLGLEPEEALALGLRAEPVVRKDTKKKVTVADYVAPKWRKWLQNHRVELNAMTNPRLLEWLDAKFAAVPSKLVPPRPVLVDHLETATRKELHQQIVERALREARVDERVEQAFGQLRAALDEQAGSIERRVRAELESQPDDWWKHPVERLAREVTLRREA